MNSDHELTGLLKAVKGSLGVCLERLKSPIKFARFELKAICDSMSCMYPDHELTGLHQTVTRIVRGEMCLN
jgi:hypothetical protein